MTLPAGPAVCSLSQSNISATSTQKQTPSSIGQDWNDEAWAVCKSDMLIKGEEADNIKMRRHFYPGRV